MSLGSIIKAKRLELGLTGLKLSQISGVNQPFIYNLENGKEVPEKSGWLLIEALQIPFDSELFSKKVREKREARKLPVNALSKLTAISRSTLYLLESNEKIPSMALCYKIAKVLELSLEDFVDITS